MKPLSFRLKIALLSACISGVVLLGFGAASWYLLYEQRVRAVDTQIRSLGTRHPGWIANRSNFDRFYSGLEFVLGDEKTGNVILLVRDAAGPVLYTSPNWPKALAPDEIDTSLQDDLSFVSEPGLEGSGAGPGRGRPWSGGRGFGPGRGGGPVVFNKRPRFFTAKAADAEWRLGILGNDNLRVVVGMNYNAAKAEINRMRTIFLGTVPIALAFAAAGGWLVAGRALRPLRTIAVTAQQVTARGLDQRIPFSDEDPEIRRLIEVLNGMMDRLEASFRQAIRFSADASHELKTPLAIMQGELENAIQASATASPEQALFGKLLEETQNLKSITRRLLLLAQADAGQLPLTLERIPLSEELEGIAEDARALAAESGLQFDLAIQPGLTLVADRGLLRMALLNLLQNAVRYNERGGSVRVALQDQSRPVLTICNSGPGIPEAEQARIFQRFYRVRGPSLAGVEGHGLGLSLAHEIIHAHHGKLLLKESRPGYTCFTVEFAKQTPEQECSVRSAGQIATPA